MAIFKNEQSRVKLEAWYDRFLKKTPVSVEHREFETSLGQAHLLLAGDPSKPTLVCLHGSLASSAHLLSELTNLLEDFRLVFIDLPGQSVKGPPVRVSYQDESLHRWVVEVIDKAGIGDFHLLGVSYGGFAAWRTAAYIPERVKKLILLVPAGIVTGSMWKGTTQLMIPLMMYKQFPSEKRLRKLFTPLFSTWDDDWAHYMGDAFREFKLDLRIPPLATDEQLRRLTMPTLVVAAGEDVSFPGKKLLDRVQGKIPHLQTELLAESKHSPPTTPEFRQWLATQIRSFLEAP
jgi:2-hydroxy-6-oxonona-2,4-dienedioate hydrolase